MPTQQSLVRFLVKPEQLLAAASLTSITYQTCRIIGPFLGAMLLIYFQPMSCLWINFCAMVIVSCILISMSFPKAAAQPEQAFTTLTQFIKNEFSEMAQVIKTSRLFHSYITIMLLYFAFITIGETQVVILLKDKLPQYKNLLGIVMSISAIGSVLAGLILTKLKKIDDYCAIITLNILLSGTGYLLFALYQPSWPLAIIAIAALLQGFGLGALIAIYSYIIKSITDMRYVGRMSGHSMSIQGIIFIIGNFSSGIIVQHLGVSNTYSLLFIAAVCISFISVGFKQALQQAASTNLKPNMLEE